MFFCQQDSFAKELESLVVSCKPAKRKLEVGGSKQQVSGWEVICEDTVLFPEGGGQNSDHGEMAGRKVLQVDRKGDKAVHFVTGGGEDPLQEGQPVLQKVDWDRRHDNMQQHSGQHLVSAVLEKEQNINTLSWWMAENYPGKVGVSYIELDKLPSPEVLASVEDRCNQVIRDSLTVTVSLLEVGDPALEESHTRGLPSDHTGKVRLVTIPGVDANLCCGTHVRNTSQLQVVKLLHTESKKGKHWLYFLVGGRVSSHLGNLVERERAMTRLLNNGPEEHLDLVEKMQKGLKVAQKNSSNLLKELATLEAAKIKADKPKFCVVHKKEGDGDFIAAFIKELDDSELLCILTVGDEKLGGPGQLVVTGQADLVQPVGKMLCDLLDGKGGGKGRFNAKINKLKNIPQIEQKVKDFLSEREK